MTSAQWCSSTFKTMRERKRSTHTVKRRHTTDFPADTPDFGSTAPGAVGVVLVGWRWSVGSGEGCGQAGEQQIEAAVEFGGAVVGG